MRGKRRTCVMRMLSLLLAVCMVLTLVPASGMEAYAEEKAELGEEVRIVPAKEAEGEGLIEEPENKEPAAEEEKEPAAEEEKEILPAEPEEKDPAAEGEEKEILPAEPEEKDPTAEEGEKEVLPAEPEEKDPAAEGEEKEVLPAEPEEKDPAAEEEEELPLTTLAVLPAFAEQPADGISGTDYDVPYEIDYKGWYLDDLEWGVLCDEGSGFKPLSTDRFDVCEGYIEIYYLPELMGKTLRYRIFLNADSQTIYSEPFTVTWKAPGFLKQPTDMVLGYGEFGRPYIYTGLSVWGTDNGGWEGIKLWEKQTDGSWKDLGYISDSVSPWFKCDGTNAGKTVTYKFSILDGKGGTWDSQEFTAVYQLPVFMKQPETTTGNTDDTVSVPFAMSGNAGDKFSYTLQVPAAQAGRWVDSKKDISSPLQITVESSAKTYRIKAVHKDTGLTVCSSPFMVAPVGSAKIPEFTTMPKGGIAAESFEIGCVIDWKNFSGVKLLRVECKESGAFQYVSTIFGNASSYVLPCHLSWCGEEKTYRIQAGDSGIYSEEFTIKWKKPRFVLQPKDDRVDPGKTVVIPFDSGLVMDTDKDGVTLQKREKGSWINYSEAEAPFTSVSLKNDSTTAGTKQTYRLAFYSTRGDQKYYEVYSDEFHVLFDSLRFTLQPADQIGVPGDYVSVPFEMNSTEVSSFQLERKSGTRWSTLQGNLKGSVSIRVTNDIGTYRIAAIFDDLAGKLYSEEFTVAPEGNPVFSAAVPAEKTFAPAKTGYIPVVPEKITVKNDGTEVLKNVKAELAGFDAEHFDITAKPASTLKKGAAAAISIKPQDGLPADHYEAELLLSADNMRTRVIRLSFVVTEAQRYHLTMVTSLGYYNDRLLPAGEVTSISASQQHDSYYFCGWVSDGGGIFGDPNRAQTTFTMPEQDVTITAEYTMVQVSPISPVSYTGKALTPNVEVRDGRKLLEKGVDYTIRYKNNVNAYTYAEGTPGFQAKKAPQAIITMRGNYTGTEIVYFVISPQKINSYYLDSIAVVYNGRKQTPIPAITNSAGQKMKYGRDFVVVEYENAKKDKTQFCGAQVYKLTVEGRGNYTGYNLVNLIICDNKRLIHMNKVQVTKITNPDPAADIEDNYQLTCGDDILKIYYDYYFYIRSSGKKQYIELKGSGVDEDGDGRSYCGSKQISYKPAVQNTVPMSKVRITGLEEKRIYNGEEQYQNGAVLTVTRPDKSVYTLEKGKDFYVNYRNNINAGTAEVIFKAYSGAGFTGSVTKKFSILPAPAADVKDKTGAVITPGAMRVSLRGSGTYAYEPGGVEPGLTVTDCRGQTLSEGKDYTVKYEDNKTVTHPDSKKTPRVTVTGKGNYTGSVTVHFTITPGNLSSCKLAFSHYGVMRTSSQKGGWYSKPEVYTDHYTRIREKKVSSSDYDVEYRLVALESDREISVTNWKPLSSKDIVNEEAAIQVIVRGKGNYTGEVKDYYLLTGGEDFSKADISIVPQVYTGEEIEIDSREQFKTCRIKIGSVYKELTPGTDFLIVGYENNRKSGTAKVTLMGNYDNGLVGVKTVSFRIQPRSSKSFWADMLKRS